MAAVLLNPSISFSPPPTLPFLLNMEVNPRPPPPHPNHQHHPPHPLSLAPWPRISCQSWAADTQLCSSNHTAWTQRVAGVGGLSVCACVLTSCVKAQPMSAGSFFQVQRSIPSRICLHVWLGQGFQRLTNFNLPPSHSSFFCFFYNPISAGMKS